MLQVIAKSEINYEDGKRHGKALEFFDSQQLSVEGTYAEGKKEGTFHGTMRTEKLR